MANDRFQPRPKAVGCMPWFGGVPCSRKREKRSLLMRHEPFDLAATLAQQPSNVVGRTIAQPNPDHLRRWPVQYAQSMKVLVLAHDHESLISSVRPDSPVGGG
jgi:hypothetical protein